MADSTKQLKVKRAYSEVRTSKGGVSYHMLCVEFDSGYVFESFLNNEQTYILSTPVNENENKISVNN